jgi:hypothetical protein
MGIICLSVEPEAKTISFLFFLVFTGMLVLGFFVFQHSKHSVTGIVFRSKGKGIKATDKKHERFCGAFYGGLGRDGKSRYSIVQNGIRDT